MLSETSVSFLSLLMSLEKENLAATALASAFETAQMDPSKEGMILQQQRKTHPDHLNRNAN
jgi:hypothetical protein